MELKHENCKNCGANDYRDLGYATKCTYCGTEYKNDFYKYCDSEMLRDESGRVVTLFMPQTYTGTAALFGHK